MKQYPEYKYSGIDWIGEIPSHWQVIRIKYAYNFQTGATPPTKISRYFEGDLPWATIADLKQRVISETETYLTKEGVSVCSMEISPKDSLMYSFKLSVGTVAFCGVDMFTNEAIATFLKGKNSLRYLYYTAPLYIIHNANYNIYGAPLLRQQLIKDAFTILPPLSEQEAIADYLDTKCGEIDALIEKQQRRISLLEELRQTTITQAVTRGLNTETPLRQSGIDWIAEIPSHWNVKPLKRIGKMGKGLTFTKTDLVDEGVPVVSYGQIHCKQNSGVKLHDFLIRYLPLSFEIAENSKTTVGDFIFADTSEDLEGCGNAVYIDDDKGIFGGYHSIVLRTPSGSNKYFAYLFKTDYWRSQIRSRVYGVKVYSVTQTILSLTSVIIPPIDEQEKIVHYLDLECAKIDKRIARIKREIELLEEYKQSVITDVVTGKRRVC